MIALLATWSHHVRRRRTEFRDLAVTGRLRPFAGRWPAIDHDRIQLLLGAIQILKVTLLEHLTVVANHLCNVDRIVPTVFRTVVVNIAREFLAVRRLL